MRELQENWWRHVLIILSSLTLLYVLVIAALMCFDKKDTRILSSVRTNFLHKGCYQPEIGQLKKTFVH